MSQPTLEDLQFWSTESSFLRRIDKDLLSVSKLLTLELLTSWRPQRPCMERTIFSLFRQLTSYRRWVWSQTKLYSLFKTQQSPLQFTNQQCRNLLRILWLPQSPSSRLPRQLLDTSTLNGRMSRMPLTTNYFGTREMANNHLFSNKSQLVQTARTSTQ